MKNYLPLTPNSGCCLEKKLGKLGKLRTLSPSVGKNTRRSERTSVHWEASIWVIHLGRFHSRHALGKLGALSPSVGNDIRPLRRIHWGHAFGSITMCVYVSTRGCIQSMPSSIPFPSSFFTSLQWVQPLAYSINIRRHFIVRGYHSSWTMKHDLGWT